MQALDRKGKTILVIIGHERKPRAHGLCVFECLQHICLVNRKGAVSVVSWSAFAILRW